ncbi:ComEC/Rec2 family competence protein [Curtobacterium sp. RHCJP20]|uniref:ComEC/Rec2 family competence protein n=1 Tax=Curtobacterium subtropicum TaxID=3055138 RepID=A0ABT7TFL6_9MICO|nr:ComEC/Rec2 family competence protein [Curtobacterium subtropicum]MDM7888384.1 ComEC/Rec2 family competence protein [Curtobacterium subtropicum]
MDVRTSVGDLRPRAAELRLAGPVLLAWVEAVLLVGVPSAAWWCAASTGAVGLVVVLVLVVLTRSGRQGGSGIDDEGAVVPDPSTDHHRAVARGVLGVVLVTAGCCALVAVAVAAGAPERSPEALVDRTDRTVSVEVVLTRDLADADRSTTGTVRALDAVGGLDVPVRVVPGERLRAAAGSTLRARGTVQLDDDGSPTAAVVFLRGHPSVVPPTGPLAATDRVRQAFVAVTDGLPEPGGALLRGLAIGDRSGLDPATEAAMETTALTHLTAVSGSNCAVVVALVVAGCRAIGLPRVVRVVVAVGFLAAFVVLVRPDPSIVRAAVMAVVVLAVRLSGRPLRGVPLLALTVLGMLVVDPWYARAPAFALSVLATGGIIVLAPPLTALLAERWGRAVAAAVAIPVAAQLACWPVTVVLAPSLPTYAVPANLVTEPLAPVVTVTGLLACLLAPVWPWGAGVVAHVAWAPAAAIGTIAHGAAALPAATLDWPAGPLGVATAGTASTAVAAAVLADRRRRTSALVAAGAVVAIGLGVVAVPRLVVRSTVPGDWSVAACDVGQGDAVLVRDGAGPVALVDTGDDEGLLLRCLELLGVDRIDLLVLTHFDRDHVGAVGAVTDRVARALVGPVGRPEDDRVVEELDRAGVEVRTADDGTSGTLGALDWRLVWPPAGSPDSGNDASLVLETMRGAACTACVTGVFLGDLGAHAQRRLRPIVESHPDVVKVAHHGSADQDPALYRQLAAPVGLIGVGADNTYGHPTAAALDALRAAGTTAFRTDEQGTVVVSRSADGALQVWTERTAPRPSVAALIGTVPARSAAAAAAVRPVAAPSAAARRIGPGPDQLVPEPTEGTHARQEALARRRRDRPGAVVRRPTGPRRSRHRARAVPGRAREQRPP